MTCSAFTVGFHDYEAKTVEVTCQIRPGVSRFLIAGLDKDFHQSTAERVQRSLAALGLALPAKQIAIALDAPFDCLLGPHIELAIVTALLGELNILDREAVSEPIIVGALSYDGRVQACAGTVLAVLLAATHHRPLLMPASQSQEVSVFPNVVIIPMQSISYLMAYMQSGHVPTDGIQKSQTAENKHITRNDHSNDIRAFELELLSRYRCLKE